MFYIVNIVTRLFFVVGFRFVWEIGSSSLIMSLYVQSRCGILGWHVVRLQRNAVVRYVRRLYIAAIVE